MRSVKATVEIQCEPEKAIQAFTHFEYLRGWWNVQKCLVDLRIGGLYILTWDIKAEGFGYVSCGIIEEYDPRSLLKIVNMAYLNPARSILGPMILEVTSEAHQEGCLLTVIQDGYGQGPDWNWYYEAVSHAWPAVLKEIKVHLESPDN